MRCADVDDFFLWLIGQPVGGDVELISYRSAANY